MRRRVFGALLVALVLLALPVQAAETIQRFTAAITIGTDGNVTVREEIRVRAEGAEIRHGLYRDLLTGLPGTYGLVRGRLDVLQVTRDGQTEPWHKTATATGVRLYLGDKDSTVSTGWHTYVLLYRLAGQIRFFGDYDELYWNVTGNAWALPVETASVTLALPGGASLLQRAAYVGRTGEQGVSGTDFTLTQTPDGLVRATTLRPLEPGEGLTVAVGWPKGVVPPLSQSAWIKEALINDPALPLGALLLAALLLYYWSAWSLVGRDPARGPVVPVYAPTWSPAAMRVVRRMGADNKTLVAALVSLASKGYLTIEERDALGGSTAPESSSPGFMGTVLALLPKSYAVVRKEGGSGASTEEEFLLRALFPDHRGEVALTRSNREILLPIVRDFQAHLDNRFNGIYYRRNLGWFGFGALMSLACWVVVGWLQGDESVLGTGLFMSFWLGLWSLGTGFLLAEVCSGWRAFLRGSAWKLVPALFMTLFAVPFVGGWGVGAFMLVQGVGVAGAVFLVLATFLNVLFFYLLRAPTLPGREVLNEADGTALYLTVAESDRLAFHTPSTTPEVFEKFLPYAIALNLETEWSTRFANRFQSVVVDSRQTSGVVHTTPSWYRGNSFTPASLAGFGAGLTSALVSATASKSSGSGGGGSSGGGSGGGGGGGW